MSKRKKAASPPLLVHHFDLAGNVYNRAVTLLYGTLEDINEWLKPQTSKGETFQPIPCSAAGQELALSTVRFAWELYLEGNREALVVDLSESMARESGG